MEAKEQQNGWRIGFIVTISVLALVVVVVIILAILAAIYYERLKKVLLAAFYNTKECDTDPNKCQYIKLDLVQPTVFTNEFNKDIALLGAQLVLDLSFRDQNHGELNLPPFLKFVTYIEGCPTCDFSQGGFRDPSPLPLGLVTYDEQTRTLYIVFRGALTSQEWQFAFNFNQQFFTQKQLTFTSGSSFSAGSLPLPCSPDTLVHSGFLALFNQVQGEVTDVVNEYNDKVDKVVIYGHSLGAAIASLMGVYLSLTFPDKEIFVYTYGKPRVGNQAYKDCVDRLMDGRFQRMENGDDLIPVLPLPTTPNFENPDDVYLYEQEGHPFNYESNWGSQTLNHGINNYINALIPITSSSNRV